MIAGIGETMVKLFGFGAKWHWAIFWVVIGIGIVFRPLYNRVESIFKIFMILLTVSLVGTAVWVGPNIGGIVKGTIAFDVPSPKDHLMPCLLPWQ